MNIYATIADLISNSLTPENANTFSDAAKLAALSGASRVVDSFIRSQQILPLTAWDDAIKIATTDIAAYRLYVSNGFDPNSTQDQNIGKRYEATMKWLEQIAAQTIIINYPDSSSMAIKAGPFVRPSNSPVGFATIFGCFNPWRR